MTIVFNGLKHHIRSHDTLSDTLEDIMTDNENCTITNFTRADWLYVYQQVVVGGKQDQNLILMGERLIKAGLATEEEVRTWRLCVEELR